MVSNAEFSPTIDPMAGRVDAIARASIQAHGSGPRPALEPAPKTGDGFGPDHGDLPTAEAVALGLETGLKARAPGTHATTPMVRELTVRVCGRLDLDQVDVALADVSTRLRDVGMLALPDSVVLATGPLSPADWELVNRHPVLGAELLASVEGFERAVPVVRGHHERWDGEGYPDGLRAESIPLLSRIISVADAFVAIATDRPHRRGLGPDAALDHLSQERGRQFDPRAVDASISVITGAPGHDDPRARRGRRAAKERVVNGSKRSRPHDLTASLERCAVLPAFVPALERLLASIDSRSELGSGDPLAAIESDIGLTVAVLRAAQGITRRPVTNVADALTALGSERVRGAVAGLPRAAFPWRSSLEGVMHQLRVHAQAVSRAAQRIAREVDFKATDDLITAALLHDVGKLVLSQGHDAFPEAWTSPLTPERRVQAERQLAGVDHASLGGLLADRWRLPRKLSATISGHHTADGQDELTTLVRLADMVAHQAHGDPVDRKLMLRLGASCGLSVPALRDALFDLPHAAGSQRRRAQPSPLSSRETAVIRRLAQGKLYKEIAIELGLSTSTVRSHLHNAYAKLEVADRAQAVLRATEMAWL